jgi:DNA modification methylase
MNEILTGDALTVLRTLPSESVQCCVTSPPYWGLRNYEMDGQLGMEETPDTYVANLVAVFEEVRRVLRADGTLWLNLGDSYINKPGGAQGQTGERQGRTFTATSDFVKSGAGLKTKDLVGIPWRVAFALQNNGWWLRSDIIWSKPNPMPESVTDRPTKAHEYIFLLTRSEHYFYDAEAIRENGSPNRPWAEQTSNVGSKALHTRDDGGNQTTIGKPAKEGKRNARTVWTINVANFPEAHFATFPEALVQRCVLAGSRTGDVVLDPFAGSGTTCAVADAYQRRFVGIELNPRYVEMARRRILRDGAPLFSGVQ